MNSRAFDEHSVDEVVLENMRIQCVMGVLPHERKRRQQVECSLRMALDVRSVATEANLKLGVDYREIRERVEFLLVEGNFFLLETAAEMIAMDVLQSTKALFRVRVTLTKPEIFDDDAIPSLQISRTRRHLMGAVDDEQAQKPVTQCLFAHRHGGLYHLELPSHTACSVTFREEHNVLLVEQGTLTFVDDNLDKGTFLRLGARQTIAFESGKRGVQLLFLTKPHVEFLGSAPTRSNLASLSHGVASRELTYVHNDDNMSNDDNVGGNV